MFKQREPAQRLTKTFDKSYVGMAYPFSLSDYVGVTLFIVISRPSTAPLSTPGPSRSDADVGRPGSCGVVLSL
jgi:hypothetical protein